MVDQGAAQSVDLIPPADVRFVVQADYHQTSHNIPCRSRIEAINVAFDAVGAGATEVRIRPVKP